MRPRLVFDNAKPVKPEALNQCFAAWLDAGVVDFDAYRRLTQPKPALRLVERDK